MVAKGVGVKAMGVKNLQTQEVNDTVNVCKIFNTVLRIVLRTGSQLSGQVFL